MSVFVICLYVVVFLIVIPRLVLRVIIFNGIILEKKQSTYSCHEVFCSVRWNWARGPVALNIPLALEQLTSHELEGKPLFLFFSEL